MFVANRGGYGGQWDGSTPVSGYADSERVSTTTALVTLWAPQRGETVWDFLVGIAGEEDHLGKISNGAANQKMLLRS